METPSIRKIKILLLATFLVCVGMSLTRHWLAWSGVAFFPTRYLLVVLGSAVLLGCVYAIAWQFRPPAWTWTLVLVSGAAILVLLLRSTTENALPIVAPTVLQNETFYRLFAGPVADATIVLTTLVLAYYFAQASIGARVARQREREQRRVEDEVRDKQQFLEQLLDSHERDRQLIAYEVHDGFVQSLTGALLHLEAGQHEQGEMAPTAKKECSRAAQLIRTSIDEARRLISGLRPPILDEQGTVAAIDYLIQEHRIAGGPPVAFVYDDQFERLSPLLEGVVFRITQEALTNIRRHARAEHVDIAMRYVNERLRLTIHDDGQGFDPEGSSARSFGLRGMEERAQSVHGKFDVDTAYGSGTRITVELPMLDATQREARGRRKAEQALYESELRLQAVLDNTTAVIYQKDAEGKYQLINSRFEELFDVRREDFLGKTDYEVFPRERAEAFRVNDADVLEAGKPIEFEELVPQDDGLHTYLSIKFPLFNAEGEPYAVCGVSSDITERKRAEETLQTAHDELERRVRERTTDLLAANEQLEREVVERNRVEMKLRVSQSQLREQMTVLMRLNSGQTFDRGELSATLAEITEAAAETLGCHRVNVWLFDDRASRLSCIEHFDRPNHEHEMGFELTAEEYPKYFAAVAEERTISADNAATDPRTGEFANTYLKKHGITSMLDASIHLRGKLVGVVCHEHVGSQRHWTVEEQNFVGSVADFVALALDADTLKRTEQALRASEHQFRRAFADGPLGMSFNDLEGHILDSNHTLSRLLGYTKSELNGRCIFQLIHPDDVQRSREQAARQFAGELPVFTIEQRLITKQNDVIWARHTASLLERTEANESPIQLSMIEDITEYRHVMDELQAAHNELEERVARRTADLTTANAELAAEVADRRAAEQGLIESEHRFRSLIANSPAGVYLADSRTGECTYTNRALQRISGLSGEASLGRGWYSILHPDDRDKVIAATAEARRSKKPFDEEFRIVLGDGSVKYVHTNSAPLRSTDGSSQETVGLVLDITTRKLAEQQFTSTEGRYRALLNAVPDLILRLDRDGNYLDSYPGEGFPGGIPAEEVNGNNLLETVPAEIAEACLKAVHRAIEEEQTCTEEIILGGDPPLRFEVRLRATGTDEVLAIVRNTTEDRPGSREHK